MSLEIPWSNDDSYTLPLLPSQPRSSLPDVISPDVIFPVFSHATAARVLIGLFRLSGISSQQGLQLFQILQGPP